MRTYKASKRGSETGSCIYMGFSTGSGQIESFSGILAILGDRDILESFPGGGVREVRVDQYSPIPLDRFELVFLLQRSSADISFLFCFRLLPPIPPTSPSPHSSITPPSPPIRSRRVFRTVRCPNYRNSQRHRDRLPHQPHPRYLRREERRRI